MSALLIRPAPIHSRAIAATRDITELIIAADTPIGAEARVFREAYSAHDALASALALFAGQQGGMRLLWDQWSDVARTERSGGIVSELESVLAEALPVMSTAVGVYGAAVLSRVEDATADATVGLGRKLLQRLWHRAARPAALESAIADLADAPEDADALSALRLQVRKALAADPKLLTEIAAILPAHGPVSASSGGVVALGGIHNSVITTAGTVTDAHNPVVIVNPTVPGPMEI